MKEKIQELLRAAKTKEALELLAQLVPEATVLLSSFAEAHRRNMLGILSFEDFSRKQNEVAFSAIELLKTIEDSPVADSTTPAATVQPANNPIKVFISYSHRDEEAMSELDKFLGPLERKGNIRIWTDRNILPGQDWKKEIMRELESADLTLLLVSANFLDSNFINDEEIPRAFKRREEAGKHVVPIILNYCLWEMTDIGTLQAVPKDGKPVASFANAAEAWNEVARAVLALLE